jgi:outer membrane lipoprotein-sorting protein
MYKKVSIFFFIVVFALVSVAVQAADKTPAQLVQDAKASVKEVSADDLKKMINSKEKVIILDIRDPSDRGLVDLHVNEIIQDKDAKIVVY